MRYFRFLAATFAITIVSLVNADEPEAPAASNLTPAQAKETLEKLGLKVSTTSVVMPAEQEFFKSMAEIEAVRKKYLAAEKEHVAVEADATKIEKGIEQLKAQYVQMNAAIAGGNLPVDQHNRAVGAIRATGAQVDLLYGQLEKQQDKVKAARSKSAEAREAYITKILAARIAADKVGLAWDKVATDPEGIAALAKVSEVLKKTIPAKASPTYTQNERQLSLLEQKILSETIKLTEDGGTFTVSVLIDGKHTKELCVDSGSTTISLPYEMAKEMGLEPDSGDNKIKVQLADGSLVDAFEKTISSVRVGKFTVENVDAIVLSPAAVKAPALLGMSFLGNFKFEIDKNKAELKMVKIDLEVAPKK